MVNEIKNIHDGKGEETCVLQFAINLSYLVIRISALCNHKFFGIFFRAFKFNLTPPLIEKRARAAASCADADSARISLACSTESIRRARVNNDRSAQSNNRTG